MPRENLNLVTRVSGNAKSELDRIESTLAAIDSDLEIGVSGNALPELQRIKAELNGLRASIDTSSALPQIRSIRDQIEKPTVTPMRLDDAQALSDARSMRSQVERPIDVPVRFRYDSSGRLRDERGRFVPGAAQGIPGETVSSVPESLDDAGTLVGAARGAAVGGARGALTGGFIGAGVGALAGSLLGNVDLPGLSDLSNIAATRQQYYSVADQIGVSRERADALFRSLRSRSTAFSDAELYLAATALLPQTQRRSLEALATFVENIYLSFPGDTGQALESIAEFPSEVGAFTPFFRQPALVGSGITEATLSTESIEFTARQLFALGDEGTPTDVQLLRAQEELAFQFFGGGNEVVNQVLQARRTGFTDLQESARRQLSNLLSGASTLTFGQEPTTARQLAPALRPRRGDLLPEITRPSVLQALQRQPVGLGGLPDVTVQGRLDEIARSRIQLGEGLPRIQLGEVELTGEEVAPISPQERQRQQDQFILEAERQQRRIGLLGGQAELGLVGVERVTEAIDAELQAIEARLADTAPGTGFALQLQEFELQLLQLKQTLRERAEATVEAEARAVEQLNDRLFEEGRREAAAQFRAFRAERAATQAATDAREQDAASGFAEELRRADFVLDRELLASLDDLAPPGAGFNRRGVSRLTSDATIASVGSLIAGNLATADTPGQFLRDTVSGGAGIGVGAYVGGAIGGPIGLAVGAIAQAGTQRLLRGILDNTSFLPGIFRNSQAEIALADEAIFGTRQLRSAPPSVAQSEGGLGQALGQLAAAGKPALGSAARTIQAVTDAYFETIPGYYNRFVRETNYTPSDYIVNFGEDAFLDTLSTIQSEFSPAGPRVPGLSFTPGAYSRFTAPPPRSTEVRLNELLDTLNKTLSSMTENVLIPLAKPVAPGPQEVNFEITGIGLTVNELVDEVIDRLQEQAVDARVDGFNVYPGVGTPG